MGQEVKALHFVYSGKNAQQYHVEQMLRARYPNAKISIFEDGITTQQTYDRMRSGESIDVIITEDERTIDDSEFDGAREHNLDLPSMALVYLHDPKSSINLYEDESDCTSQVEIPVEAQRLYDAIESALELRALSDLHNTNAMRYKAQKSDNR